jgi:hypothetical protein
VGKSTSDKSYPGGVIYHSCVNGFLMDLVMPIHNDVDGPSRDLPIMSGVGFPVRSYDRLYTKPL